MSSARFVTRQPGDYVLSELYQLESGPFFQVTLEVPISEEDRVTKKPVRLFVSRTPNKEAVYTHPNGDLVFESHGRLDPMGYPFKVSIFLEMGDTRIKGASIAVERYAVDVIHQHLNVR